MKSEPCPKCKSTFEFYVEKDNGVTEVWCGGCHELKGLIIEERNRKNKPTAATPTNSKSV